MPCLNLRMISVLSAARPFVLCLFLLRTLPAFCQTAPPPAAPPQMDAPQSMKRLNAQGFETRINAKDGAEMIVIPAGEFLMGDDDDAIQDLTLPLHPRNNPRHKVTLSAYCIYKNLVTVGQFRKFVAATGYKFDTTCRQPSIGDKEDHPAVYISWDGAAAYCKWAGGHLPTEAQWEKAARGTDGRKYPWGDMWDVSKVWASKQRLGDTGGIAAVGKYGISPYGVTDMAGNANQWCADFYDTDFMSSLGAIEPDPQNRTANSKKYHTFRGGSWLITYPDYFRASFRLYDTASMRLNMIGFRCVCSP